MRSEHALISLSRQNKDNCFRSSELSRNTVLNAQWKKRLQKVVRGFLDADDNLDSQQNIIITFWPIYNVPWNLHANSFHGICIKSTN